MQVVLGSSILVEPEGLEEHLQEEDPQEEMDPDHLREEESQTPQGVEVVEETLILQEEVEEAHMVEFQGQVVCQEE